MTAEISVMNKLAVAMAADSAVTNFGKKVYNTGSKLFPVTHKLSIGFMFYGNGNFLGVPWETILAAYRVNLGDRHFDTVKQSGDHFIGFLQSNRDLFPVESQRKYFIEVVKAVLSNFLNLINQSVQNLVAKKGAIDEEEIRKIIKEVFATDLEQWKNAPFLGGIDDTVYAAFKEKYSADFEALISDIFKNLPMEAEFKAQLSELCANYGCKALVFNYLKSGVVFCGFGEAEKYPSLFSVEMDLVVENRVKTITTNLFSISDEMPASIHPFAQQDVVASFLKGIDPSFMNLIDGYMKSFFEELFLAIDANLPTEGDSSTKLKEILGGLKGRAASTVLQKLNEASQTSFVGPAIMAAQILSKDDLAHMAETLVSLTSFRRKISLDLETVGGPIDVAVISKKDGFIWIKRKHYFNAELNPQFFGGHNGRGEK